MFLNELFLCLTKSDIDDTDNTVKVTNKKLEKHLRTLEDESNSPVTWCRNGNLIAKPHKFEAIETKIDKRK